MDSGCDQVEAEHRNAREDRFEAKPLRSPRLVVRPMYTVQQLRGGDHRDRERIICRLGEASFEIQVAALDGNEDARIDQGSHGESGTVGCVRATSSTTHRLCSTRWRSHAAILNRRGAVVELGGAGLLLVLRSQERRAAGEVLDGCVINERHWVFAARLTDVGVELTVTDTRDGSLRTYTHAPGTAGAGPGYVGVRPLSVVGLERLQDQTARAPRSRGGLAAHGQVANAAVSWTGANGVPWGLK
jgi:hypothetical protein